MVSYLRLQNLEMNWLFLDHEVVSDTMLIDYLNPTGQLDIRCSSGSRTSWVNNMLVRCNDGTVGINQLGYNCSVPGCLSLWLCWCEGISTEH